MSDELEGEEEFGEETEFGMVDGREREPIRAWVGGHRHLFGSGKDKGKGKEVVGPKTTMVPAGPLTIQNLPDESDDEDAEFVVDCPSDLDGSERMSEEEEEDGEESGSEAEEGDSDRDVYELSEDEPPVLDPARHPLLRAGALPRMSKSVREMVTGIVEEVFVGPAGQQTEEVDELDHRESITGGEYENEEEFEDEYQWH